MSQPHRIVDVHAHIGRTVTSDIGQSVDEWVSLMAAAGIDQAVISVAAGGVQAEGIADTRRANDAIAAAVRDRPDLFPLGLASVEVRHGDAGLAEVRRVFDDLGLGGLAFHATFEGFTVSSPAFAAVLDAVGDRRALVLVHSTPDAKASPGAIAEVAGRYPHLEFVMGHPVFTPEQRTDAVTALHSTSNLSLDIAYQSDPATTTFFVRELGAERILFGSDAPFFSPEAVIASVGEAEIGENARSLILAGNAERLIAGLSG
jgi:predicted TIM-barrel fold metal-dependent hydrolase